MTNFKYRLPTSHGLDLDQYKMENEKIVKHMNLIEKDLEIYKRKYDLLTIENNSLRNQVEVMNTDMRETSTVNTRNRYSGSYDPVGHKLDTRNVQTELNSSQRYSPYQPSRSQLYNYESRYKNVPRYEPGSYMRGAYNVQTDYDNYKTEQSNYNASINTHTDLVETISPLEPKIDPHSDKDYSDHLLSKVQSKIRKRHSKTSHNSISGIMQYASNIDQSDENGASKFNTISNQEAQQLDTLNDG